MILKTNIEDEVEKNKFIQALERSIFNSKAAFLKHIIRVYLLKSEDKRIIKKTLIKPMTKDDLVEVNFPVRIPFFLKREATQRAEDNYGIKRAVWIRNLITANLSEKPILIDVQVNELRTANRELAAIGRNINQLTKILNRSAELKLRDRVSYQHLIDIKETVEKHKKAINAVIASSNGIWGLGNGSN